MPSARRIVICSFCLVTVASSVTSKMDHALLLASSDEIAIERNRSLSRYLISAAWSTCVVSRKTCISIPAPAGSMPEFGRTEYCFGAVVLTLNATGFAFGLTNFNTWAIPSLNGLLKSSCGGSTLTDKPNVPTLWQHLICRS